MTRVLLDCRMVDWSGIGRYTRGLARGLAARDDVEIVQVVGPRDEAPVPGADVVRTTRAPFSLLGAGEMARVARAVSPDVTHALHIPTPVPAPVPLVVTLHDLTPLIITGSMPSRMHRLVYRALNARAVRVATRVIVPSAATRVDLARFFPAASRKTIVVPEAVDDFSAGPITDHGLTMPYVLSFAGGKAHKGLPELLAAFKTLAAAHPDLGLVLVGEKPADCLDPYADPLMRSRVSFIGNVDDARLRSLYEHAVVFAFPSRYEGFGLPPLEAMALGAPVVTTNVASIPEVVGDAGLLVAPGDPIALADAVERLLSDERLRRSLVERGHRRAAAFSWRETARLTVDVYHEAMAGLR